MKIDFSKQPFVLLTILVITGILLGKFLFSYENTIWISSTLFILFLLSLFILKNKLTNQLFLFASLIFLMALKWNSVYKIPDNHIVFQDYSKTESITGLVTEAKYKNNNRNKYTISVTHAESNNQQISTKGKILLSTIKVNQKFVYGDLLKIKCQLQEPKSQRNPGQFDYKNYLADEDVFLVSYINHKDSVEILKRQAGNIFIHFIIEPVRIHFSQSLSSFISSENSPILKALILGEKQDIDKDILEQFKNVGVVHVLAISGLHVGFIIIFVMVLLSLFRLKYNHQIYALLIMLFIYVVLINFKAPVIRASLMAGLYLLAKLSERKVSLYNIVFFVAFFLLIIDPRDLFNPGFQFSFTAVLSIVYGYKKLNNYFPLKSKIDFKKNRLIKKFFIVFIWDASLVSIAAVLGTLPLTIYYYGIVPTYALFANIIVIPLIGLIVMMGLMMLIVSLFSSLLAATLGNFIDLIFDFLKIIIEYFYNLPYSFIYSTTPSLLTILLLMLLVYLIFNIISRKHQIFTLGVVLIIIFLNISKNNNTKNLEVTFLDVGQGDASFVKFPNGESMLIDGGDATKDWDQGKNAILPFLKYNNVSNIKYVVASHPHNDHIGGLTEILKTVKVDTLVISAYEFNTKKYSEMIGICKTKGIPIRYVGKGNQLFPDSSCRVYILHPSDEFVEEHDFSGVECNNSSIVMKIQYGENGILFTGDAEKDAETAYSQYGNFLESEMIKTGHHGSKTSSTQKMLGFVNPLAAVISVAERNKFRHPSPVTIDKFEYNHIKPFLTSSNGAVQFRIAQNEIILVNWNKNSIKFF
jgi:competence protein ComEC